MVKLSAYSPVKPNITKTRDNNPKTPKVKNKGYIRASYLEGIATTPLTLLAASIVPTFKKLGTLSEEQTTLLKPVIEESLQKSGLADKGVKTLYIETYKKGKEKLPDELFGIKFQDILKKGAEQESDSFLAKHAKKLYTNTVKYMGQLTETLINPSEQDQKFINMVQKEGEMILEKNPLKGLFDKLVSKNADKKPAMPGANELPPELTAQIEKIMSASTALPHLLKFKNGNNAAYFTNTKNIVLPDDKLTLSAFHEMGHAVIDNFGKLSKIPNKLRPLSFALPSLITFIALTNPRKVNDEKPTNATKFQKCQDFVKRNAGKLTLLSFMPVIADEALASMNGNKIAKSVLSKDMLKRVKLTNALGFATYIAGGIIGGVGVATAVKYKDKIQTKYEHKLELKAQKKAEKQAKKQILK